MHFILIFESLNNDAWFWFQTMTEPGGSRQILVSGDPVENTVKIQYNEDEAILPDHADTSHTFRKFIQEISVGDPLANVTVEALKPERVLLCCNKCDYRSFHKHALDRHTQAVHEKVKFYQCLRCDYKTGHSSALKRHESKVHEKSLQAQFSCEACDYHTVHKSALKRHIANVHQKDSQTNHQCSICDYRTTYEFALQRHYTTVHLKEGTFECSVCEYSTVHKHALDRHVKMVHEKPAHLSCDICEYKSAHKSSLRLHYATVHECKDTYKCDKCGYETLYKTALARHQTTVTCGQGGEKVAGVASPNILAQLRLPDPEDQQIVYVNKEESQVIINSPPLSDTNKLEGNLPGMLPVGYNNLVPITMIERNGVLHPVNTIQLPQLQPREGLEYHSIGDIVQVVRSDVSS